MTDVPEDIRKTAENCIPAGLIENHYRSTLRQHIEDALMVERERCAKIAETWPDAPFAKTGQWHGTLRKSIVYGIRSSSVEIAEPATE